jgi:hypothetical protein
MWFFAPFFQLFVSLTVFMRNGKEVKTTANAPDKYNLSLASSDL